MYTVTINYISSEKIMVTFLIKIAVKKAFG